MSADRFVYTYLSPTAKVPLNVDKGGASSNVYLNFNDKCNIERAISETNEYIYSRFSPFSKKRSPLQLWIYENDIADNRFPENTVLLHYPFDAIMHFKRGCIFRELCLSRIQYCPLRRVYLLVYYLRRNDAYVNKVYKK